MTSDSETSTVYQVPSPDERRRIHADIVKKQESITDDQYHTFIKTGLSDLRTELTGLLGYLSLLSAGDFGKLPTKKKEVVDNLRKSAESLIADTGNLIALGKLNANASRQKQELSSKRYKILHFEDECMLRGMYETKFQMRGFDFSGYDSPTKDPVSLILKEKPDLIIMDIIMPISDGFTATKQLKADARTKDIPILGLCNLGQRQDIEKAHSVGMADYLVSANHMPNEVIERVCEIIGIPVPKEKPLQTVIATHAGDAKRQQKSSWWQRLLGK